MTLFKTVSVVKRDTLNTRLFCDLWVEGESEYENPVFHTEERWLSRGNITNRVWLPRNELKMFLIKQQTAQIGLRPKARLVLHFLHI